jgi:hypothetical protein
MDELLSKLFFSGRKVIISLIGGISFPFLKYLSGVIRPGPQKKNHGAFGPGPSLQVMINPAQPPRHCSGSASSSCKARQLYQRIAAIMTPPPPRLITLAGDGWDLDAPPMICSR